MPDRWAAVSVPSLPLHAHIMEADRQSIHGDNESIDCANYLRMIDWYKAFIEGFDGEA
jgi:hypothetical protein